MEKKDLIELLNQIFIPLGFKRKGNNILFHSSETGIEWLSAYGTSPTFK
jgi:hypothetical protein